MFFYRGEILKGASENRRLFDRKIRLLELDDFGDSNANLNANGRKKMRIIGNLVMHFHKIAYIP